MLAALACSGLWAGGPAQAIVALGNPTAVASVGELGTRAWTNPAQAVSSNNGYATASVDGTTTRALRCTGYGFSVPAGATVTGIIVNVERRSSSVANGGSRDAAMRLVKRGVIGSTDRATATTYTTADVVEAHGGAADLWGEAWTPADINAADFGAAFAATKASAAGAAHTISVDHVQVTVNFSLAPFTQTASPAACEMLVGWSNPTRAMLSDNSRATVALDGTTSHLLQATGYGFAIPAGSVINGITVNVERRSSSTGNGGSRDAVVRILKGGVIGTADRATATSYTTGDVVEAHGGATDLWGQTWTVADINAGNFGVAFAATKPNAAGAAQTVSVDHLQVAVDYTPGPGTYSITRSPGACASVAGIGTVNWSNPTRARLSDNSRSRATLDGTTSRYLRCNTYGFAIPPTATIVGITVDVERRSNRTSNGGSRDAAMRVVKGGVIGATDRSTATTYTTADVVEAHGSSSDLWGDVWTPADINAANFGAAFAATKASAAGPSHQVDVDHMPITVTFTVGPVGPDHVELVHDGAAVTCTAKPVTFLACTTTTTCQGLPAGQYTTAPVSVTLNAIAGATWCADALCATTLPSPASLSNGAVIYLRQPVVGTHRMGGTASGALTPAVQCTNTATAAALNATTECDVSYADAGFIFDVPHHRAENAQNITVSAVKKSDNSLACVPAFASVSKTVNFKCAYVTPNSGTLPVRIGGAALNAANNAAAACDATGRDFSLAFDATGVAAASVIYADVGNMTLSARYAPTSGADAGLVMTGSDNFIAAPTDFTVTNAGPFVAGSAFSSTVTARNATGTATPNFGKEGESVTLALGSRIEPAGASACPNAPCDGTVAGSVTAPWSGGATTVVNASYSEVGTMTLRATLASGNYLGSGLAPAATGVSATTGPFVPAYFDTAVTHGCVAGAFTYSAQPFKVDVTAKNAATATTVNYSSLPPCAVCSRNVTLQDPLATANFNATNTVAATSFANGVGSNSLVAYTFPTPTTAPTAITLRAIDASVTPNVSSAGHTEGATMVHSGRARLLNANGSELLALPLPLTIQHWAGAATGWTTHAADTCTVFAAPNFAFSFPVAAGNNLAACETFVSVTGAPPNYSVSLSAPGAGNAGWTDITLHLGAIGFGTSCTSATPGAVLTSGNAWLRYNWKGAGLANPTARATFGVVKSGPVIHRREMY